MALVKCTKERTTQHLFQEHENGSVYLMYQFIKHRVTWTQTKKECDKILVLNKALVPLMMTDHLKTLLLRKWDQFCPFTRTAELPREGNPKGQTTGVRNPEQKAWDLPREPSLRWSCGGGLSGSVLQNQVLHLLPTRESDLKPLA